MTAFSFLSSKQHVVLDHQRLGPARLTAGFPVWYIKIKSQNWAGEVSEHTFHGHHPKYNEFVSLKLEQLHTEYGSNLQVYVNKIMEDLLPELRSEIIFAENLIKTNPAWSGKTLNDYFKILIPVNP